MVPALDAAVMIAFVYGRTRTAIKDPIGAVAVGNQATTSSSLLILKEWILSRHALF